jgi:hypothetical protein
MVGNEKVLVFTFSLFFSLEALAREAVQSLKALVYKTRDRGDGDRGVPAVAVLPKAVVAPRHCRPDGRGRGPRRWAAGLHDRP